MRLRTIARLLVLGLCLTGLCSGAQARVIVFGDSYSDNGNDFALTGGRYPNPVAYYKGRFSNGPVWSEYFAKYQGVNPADSSQFINYAYGQAKILGETHIVVHAAGDKAYTIPGLVDQISAFEHTYNHIDPDDYVLLFISTNDFFDVSLGESQAKLRAFFVNMADVEQKQINRLINLGAKHVIVLNGRDVSLSPLARIFIQKTLGVHDERELKQYLVKFRGLIQVYNHALSEHLTRLNNRGVVMYDIFSFDNLHVHKTDMCYQNQMGDYENVAGSICKHPENYFFYDRIHTTATVNKLLAKDVLNSTNKK